MRLSFFTTLACVTFSHAIKHKGIDDPWSFDVNAGQYADWMDTIADNTLVSSLSIPGTHNSMTYDLKIQQMRTQNVHLSQQLTGGIRYIDITCKSDNFDIMVYHGLFNTGFSFGGVLRTIFDFLDKHPREAIILRIQRSTLSDLKAFSKYFSKYFDSQSNLGKRISQRIYPVGTNGITAVPTLGELRGRVLILQDFETTPPGYGLPWNTDTVSSYSRRFSASTTSTDSKWDDIKSHLSEAPLASSTKLRITHTTASFGVIPINFAARNAPKVGMNKHLGQYLRDERGSCFGIVAMDFPGQDVVKQILSRNNKYQIPGTSGLPSDNDAATVDSHGT
ncbi:1-phosphatidylinositol phosphodiesterase [Ceratocystis platani]|uniref:1-phosphatidylinositol phosphodiesterase n=1 Tax=Ceratocystis fimbriata f. sp. platani TaxID=88771 RepID=A0A0F8DHW2_CERFI|nr:1-phosphatidylinositol phosphodiesterase [Ceratocystis platani]